MSKQSLNRRVASGTAMAALASALAGLACTGNAILYGTLPVPVGVATNTDLTLGIAIVTPNAIVEAQSGGLTSIQWADIATVAGTVVRLEAQREAPSAQGSPLPDAFTGPVLHLIGDGTPGSGRDALSDGTSDILIWDLTGVRVGDYQIRATIESPDGQTKTVKSHDDDRNVVGVIRVLTALAVPTLTFTAPGAADETFNAGDTFNITWTDNGDANADALITLALDPDDTRNNGDEIVLLSNVPLSTDGNAGSFAFTGVDENGVVVPNATYTVFATIDDNAHDPITAAATGQLIVDQ